MSDEKIGFETEKPWYRSRTVWAAIVTIAASLGGMFGVVYTPAEQGEVIDALITLTTSVSGAVALVGRLAARDRLGR